MFVLSTRIFSKSINEILCKRKVALCAPVVIEWLCAAWIYVLGIALNGKGKKVCAYHINLVVKPKLTKCKFALRSF